MKMNSARRFSTAMWHALAAGLILLLASGCKETNPGAPAVQPAPAPVASTSSLSQLPKPVQDAFKKEYKNSKIVRVSHRMHPDGVAHYTINSVDEKGKSHVDEYRADGVKVGK